MAANSPQPLNPKPLKHPPALAKTTKKIQTASNLTPLGTTPGVKQRLLYALREFQSSVVGLLGTKPTQATPVNQIQPKKLGGDKIGVVLDNDAAGKSIAGFMINNTLMNFSEAKKATKSSPEDYKAFRGLLRAINTGHRVKQKGLRKKIGEKLYIDETVLKQKAGFLFKKERVVGTVITPENYRELAQSIRALDPKDPANATKIQSFEQQLKSLSSLKSYKDILTTHEAQKTKEAQEALTAQKNTLKLAFFESKKTQLERFEIPEIKTETTDSLKESHKKLTETETNIQSIKLELEDSSLKLDETQQKTLEKLKNEKLALLAEKKTQIAHLLTAKAIETIREWSYETLQKNNLAPILDTLMPFGLTADQRDTLQTTQSTLQEFSKILCETTPQLYDTLTPQNRQLILDGYQKEVFFKGDPQSEAIINRLGQMCRIPTEEDRHKFVNDRVQELFSGNFDILVMIQEHISKADLAHVSEAEHLDDMIAHIIQKTFKDEALDKAKIQHALRICARYLCKEVATDQPFTKTPSLLFSPQTIKALTSNPSIKIPTLDIVLGQVMILQHQLTPFPNLEDALNEVGIHMSPEKIQTYFAKGVKSSETIDEILNTLTNFSRSMGKQDSMRTLLTSVFEQSPHLLVTQFEALIHAKQTGSTGASKDIIKLNRHVIGSKLPELPTTALSTMSQLTDQKSVFQKGLTHSEKNKVLEANPELSKTLDVIFEAIDTAKSKSKDSSRLKSLGKTQTLLEQCCRLADFTPMESHLEKCQKENVFKTAPTLPQSISEFIKAFQDTQTKIQYSPRESQLKIEAQTQLQKEIDRLDAEIETLYDSNEALFQPTVNIIRLSILTLYAQLADQPDATAQLQSGKHTDQIIAGLAPFGLNNSLTPLVHRELAHFSGPKDFEKWQDQIGLNDTQRKEMGIAAKGREAPHYRQLTGLDSQLHTQVNHHMTTMKVGEKFSCAWGSTTIVKIPEAFELAQEVLSGGGVGVSLSVEGHKEKQFWVEKVTTQAGDGFNVFFGKEYGGKLGVNLDFAGGFASLDLGAAMDETQGFRLHFNSLEAATQFVTSVMIQDVTPGIISSADVILESHGTRHILSATATFQPPNPLAKFVPEIHSPSEFINASISTSLFKIQVGIEGSSSKETAQNIYQKEVTKTKEFKVSLHPSFLSIALKNPFDGIETEGFEGNLELRLSANRSVTSRGNFIETAQINEEISFSFPSKTATQMLAALTLLSEDSTPELKKPEVKAKLRTLLKTAEPSDTLQLQYELKDEIKWKISALMDPNSGKTDPDTAKTLLKDKQSYVLRSIKIQRNETQSTEKEHNIHLQAYKKTESQLAGKQVIIGEIQL